MVHSVILIPWLASLGQASIAYSVNSGSIDFLHSKVEELVNKLVGRVLKTWPRHAGFHQALLSISPRHDAKSPFLVRNSLLLVSDSFGGGESIGGEAEGMKQKEKGETSAEVAADLKLRVSAALIQAETAVKAAARADAMVMAVGEADARAKQSRSYAEARILEAEVAAAEAVAAEAAETEARSQAAQAQAAATKAATRAEEAAEGTLGGHFYRETAAAAAEKAELAAVAVSKAEARLHASIKRKIDASSLATASKEQAVAARAKESAAHTAEEVKAEVGARIQAAAASASAAVAATRAASAAAEAAVLGKTLRTAPSKWEKKRKEAVVSAAAVAAEEAERATVDAAAAEAEARVYPAAAQAAASAAASAARAEAAAATAASETFQVGASRMQEAAALEQWAAVAARKMIEKAEAEMTSSATRILSAAMAAQSAEAAVTEWVQMQQHQEIENS
eukprot:gnl/MRDRNA2_/MRDRNA2_109827_c0_seq1.p1 gnl/MRDRNA2_/MRDRNA2_109827_c0~~gnl/MRDRNA2_/MRDRNA2_109827_c0_seq1.p1  ORF type:complete len:453 (-),score=174.01 gnl/MRDRNA2_/MRDRNA2_109827_c0_seq1:18-1376(-)